MTSLLLDLRFALRNLARTPGFTLMVIFILGLGMGATTAVVDLTNLLAWRQVPVERPEELAKVFTASQRGFVGPYGFTSYPDYLDYRDASRSFTGLAAHNDYQLRLGTDGATEYAWGTAVTGNYFATLRLGTFRGRALTGDDDRPGAAPVAVVAYHLWRRLGADPDILGTSLTVEGQAFTVVGIGPPGFTNTNAGTISDLFFPLACLPAVLGEEDLLEKRQRPRFYVIGRLRSGTSRDAAQAELTVLSRQLDREHPLTDDRTREVSTTPAHITHPVDLERIAPTLRLFAAAVALLLIITCANVAHLLLARSSSRYREMAVRQSIGASRGVLVRQLLTENLLLALGGGLCGMVLAGWARAFMAAFYGAEFAGEMRFDARVLGAAFLVCLAATLLFGLAPALTASQVNLTTALKDGATGGRRRRITAGQLLAGAQVALCVVLLVAGALLAQSLRNRLDAHLGFDSENLLIATLGLPDVDYSRDQGIAFFQQLRQRAEALPGVEQAGTAMIVPPILFDISLPFRLPEDPDNLRSSRINFVDGAYFSTMGIAVEQGRVFRPSDATSETGVAVVNRLLAEQLWPGVDPMGRTIQTDASRPGDPGPDYVVVGVVGSVSQHRSSDGGEPVLYYSSAQRYRSHRHLILRSATAPAAGFEALRGLLREMDPSLAFKHPRTGEANRLDAFAFERMQAQAVGVFAVLGFILAVVGIFGVLSYSVSRRIREIGIRMAIGARRRDVRRLVVRQGLWMTLAGTAAGLAATTLSSRLLESLLFGVTTSDVRVLAVVLLAVLAASIAAAYLPARRASRLDPLQALRHE